MSKKSNPSYEYVGSELELFQHASNWKSYFASLVRPHLRGEVLEVGAGIGATSLILRGDGVERWTSLEPDPVLAEKCEEAYGKEPSLASRSRVIVGSIEDLPEEPRFDAILYIDVLEHIEDHEGEARRAVARLAPGGRLIVLSPAHQWLFTPFDEALGHFRRYTRKSLGAAVPEANSTCVFLGYLDSVGLLASLGNCFLRQSVPTLKQILFWDRVFVPVSRRIDRLFGHRLGKSVLGVWEKSPATV